MHPLIERIEQSLAGIDSHEPIEIRGGWSRSLRRTYREGSQAGSGAGPFADVVDEIDDAAFVVVLVQRALLKTGRNRLWRLRDALAADLPADVRDLLTRRRAGAVDPI